MKLTTLLILLILTSCTSQENGFDNPNFNKDFNESKARKEVRDSDTKLTLPSEEDENDYNIEISDTQLVLGGKYIKGKFYQDPQFLDNKNYIRDNCGQWWERNIEYGEWRNTKTNIYERTDLTGIDQRCFYTSICCEPTCSVKVEYRLDKDNKIEYSRTVKVTYKKIEL